MAWRTALTRSMESATGLLYIEFALVMASTIVAALLKANGVKIFTGTASFAGRNRIQVLAPRPAGSSVIRLPRVSRGHLTFFNCRHLTPAADSNWRVWRLNS